MLATILKKVFVSEKSEEEVPGEEPSGTKLHTFYVKVSGGIKVFSTSPWLLWAKLSLNLKELNNHRFELKEVIFPVVSF